jgi:hypothetical protein
MLLMGVTVVTDRATNRLWIWLWGAFALLVVSLVGNRSARLIREYSKTRRSLRGC